MINLNNTPSRGPLRESDMVHRIVKPLPAGLDYQGRYETRPEPAEASTDIGADDDSQFGALGAVRSWAWIIAPWVIIGLVAWWLS